MDFWILLGIVATYCSDVEIYVVYTYRIFLRMAWWNW